MAKSDTKQAATELVHERTGERAVVKSLPSREVVFRHIDKFATPAWAPAIETLLVTLVLHFSLNYLGWTNGWWQVIIPMAFTRVRLFIVFHDMAHESFFPNNTANFIGGTLLGAFLWCPRSFWAKGHNYHHAHSNNLRYNQYSQSSPWTLDNFKRTSSFGRMVCFVCVCVSLSLTHSLSHAHP
jgi:fatty acid desaturase